MKIFKKRFIAFVIDLLILGCLIFILKQFVTIRKNSFEYAALFLPLFFRDFIFKGASIGKAIVGIRIYGKEWESPSFFLLLKRSVLTSFFVVRALLHDGKILGSDVVFVYYLERDKLGTKVIDKKVFKRINSEARLLSGSYIENMNKLYDDYMKSLYPQNDA